MNQKQANTLSGGFYSEKGVHLKHITGLNEREQAALNSLQMVQRLVSREADIIRQGERLSRVLVMREGWAIRYATMPDGRRQILSFVLPGDFISLHLDLNNRASFGVTSVTACKIVEIDGQEIGHALRSLPAMVETLNWYVRRELTVLGDHTMRLGRMTAYERVCHLLLEIWYRQKFSGDVGDDNVAAFPLTQAILADALGLSVVHVNRQVMRLRREELVSIAKRKLTIHDDARLRDFSGFRTDHLEPPAPEGLG